LGCRIFSCLQRYPCTVQILSISIIRDDPFWQAITANPFLIQELLHHLLRFIHYGRTPWIASELFSFSVAPGGYSRVLIYCNMSWKFIRSTDRAKSRVLVRASRPILLPDIIGRSSSETRARNALFRFVPVLHFLLLESKGDLSYLESFCGVLRLLFFRTFFFLPRDRSAKRERARRRKGQTLRPNGNEQRRNEKMRCPGHPHLERRVEAFRPVAFPVPPSSGGACVGDAPPEIGLEALTLPTSRQLMAVGHDDYQKAPMKMNISHGGVCIFMLGVLLSCDPAAYVRPVAHASYLFRAGGVNSDSIRVFNPAAEMLS
ncbi:Cytochrome c biogenesis CcmF C-terminal-like mitochondrial protein, partial [Sesamum angolense]